MRIKSNNKFINNVLNLAISNFIGLFIGILSSFITPYALGHQNYGYYKIFLLYSSYVPLLHIGFIDGIMVTNAGKTMDKINVQKFRTYTRFLFYMEAFFSAVICLVSLFTCKDFYTKEILFSVSIYSLLFNMLTYFQFFSKCVMRFSQLAKISRAQSYMTLLYLLVAYVIYRYTPIKIGMEYYIFFYSFTVFIAVCWYIYIYRKIVFGRRYSLIEEKNNIISFFKIGFMVMISYQLTMFIINADNQFISMFFNVSVYAGYAFAYSMASLLITFFSAVSAVMLPYMKKKGKEKIIEDHSNYLSLMAMIIFIILIVYYPIVEIVREFMPSYIESISYLRVIFPAVGLTCIIQSFIFNNYILINKIKEFCIISILNLLFDFLCYYLFYFWFRNPFFISLLSVLMIFIWYVSLEIYLKLLTEVKVMKNMVYIFILIMAFILVNMLDENMFIGLLIYAVLYVVMTYLFFRRINKYLI